MMTTPADAVGHMLPGRVARRTARLGAGFAVLGAASILMAGCEWLEPGQAGASPTAEAAVAEAREVTESIASVREQYRRAPSAGAHAGDERHAGARTISPNPPPFELRPRYGAAGTDGSCASLFDGRIPVEVLPPEYVMPEDVYWSFAIFLELGRPGEAFDLLDDATRRAVRPHLIHRLQAHGQPGDGLAMLPTRELWNAAMTGIAPTPIEIISLRTAMTTSDASVIITPVSGEEISVRFTLGPEGWRMNLVPFLGDGRLVPTWSSR